ncbi:MAG: HD domain-containing protein [Candidatus Wildermuthbacteria bacterium]|nr:HD domain-containing protein [Candidatus Wildermuthbacteria bacterium]
MRFSATPQHFHESVAEHSFFVAYISSLLCDMLEKAGEKPMREKALTMALVHDMEEMFSGDILTPFKHYSAEVRETIRGVNRQIIPQAFEGLPQEMKAKYIHLWNEDADGISMEAQIVKAADRLSLLAKCAEEVKVGNGFFEHIYKGHLETLLDYKEPWWQKIKADILPNP